MEINRVGATLVVALTTKQSGCNVGSEQGDHKGRPYNLLPE